MVFSMQYQIFGFGVLLLLLLSGCTQGIGGIPVKPIGAITCAQFEDAKNLAAANHYSQKFEDEIKQACEVTCRSQENYSGYGCDTTFTCYCKQGFPGVPSYDSSKTTVYEVGFCNKEGSGTSYCEGKCGGYGTATDQHCRDDYHVSCTCN